jgi:hypothetical protein
MSPEPEDRIARVLSSSGDELNCFVHETDEEALLAMLENPNLEQAHVTLLLGRLDLPDEPHPRAIKLALENAVLAESQVLKVLAKAEVPERVVVAIAQHPKWSGLQQAYAGSRGASTSSRPRVARLERNCNARKTRASSAKNHPAGADASRRGSAGPRTVADSVPDTGERFQETYDKPNGSNAMDHCAGSHFPNRCAGLLYL